MSSHLQPVSDRPTSEGGATSLPCGSIAREYEEAGAALPVAIAVGAERNVELAADFADDVGRVEVVAHAGQTIALGLDAGQPADRLAVAVRVPVEQDGLAAMHAHLAAWQRRQRALLVARIDAAAGLRLG